MPSQFDHETSMEFIGTARYQRSASDDSRYLPLPQHWEQFEHPNSDIYYYNRSLQLITPENVRDPVTLQLVLDARADHLQCLEEDSCLSQLADDWELTLADVTDSAAVIGMYSRQLGVAYNWTEERGLEIRQSPEHFWSHVAEYPSHREELPPNTEAAFVQALNKAKTSVVEGAIFPFSAKQIDQINGQYQYLKALQTQGRNVIPAIGWLMGAVMPLDACGKTCSDEDLKDLMERMRF